MFGQINEIIFFAFRFKNEYITQCVSLQCWLLGYASMDLISILSKIIFSLVYQNQVWENKIV